jgi:hypothetical protein
VRAVEPHLASAPAESDDAEFLRIRVTNALCPSHGRIEIGRDLRIGNLCDHLHDLLDIGDARDVAFAREECGGHREVAQLGETAADVLDVLVDPEDLVHDQHCGKRTAISIARRPSGVFPIVLTFTCPSHKCCD